jgi:hypothetical protein
MAVAIVVAVLYAIFITKAYNSRGDAIVSYKKELQTERSTIKLLKGEYEKLVAQSRELQEAYEEQRRKSKEELSEIKVKAVVDPDGAFRDALKLLNNATRGRRSTTKDPAVPVPDA